MVAEDLVNSLAEKFTVPLQVLATFKGADLEGCHYTHPLYERVSPLVLGGDYITTDSGTGLVHTAPGHGQEDYQVIVCVCGGGGVAFWGRQGQVLVLVVYVSRGSACVLVWTSVCMWVCCGAGWSEVWSAAAVSCG